MIKMKPSAVCLLVSLSLLIRVSEGCSCSETSDEDKFCAGDFALKVTVNDVSESDKFTKYAVSIDTEYRAGDEIEDAESVVVSPKDTCGVQMESGKSYFVTGTFETDDDGNTVLGTNACEILTDPSDQVVKDILRADLNCEKRDIQMREALRSIQK